MLIGKRLYKEPAIVRPTTAISGSVAGTVGHMIFRNRKAAAMTCVAWKQPRRVVLLEQFLSPFNAQARITAALIQL